MFSNVTEILNLFAIPLFPCQILTYFIDSRQNLYKTKAPTKSEDIQEHSIFLKPKEDKKIPSSQGTPLKHPKNHQNSHNKGLNFALFTQITLFHPSDAF